MSIKKVLILENDSVLNAGVKSLLLGNIHLNVYGAVCTNVGDLNLTIDQIKPDIIIADETDSHLNSVEILDFLKVYPGVKTILINLEDNQIEVYDKKQVFVKVFNDFLSELL